MNTMIEIPRLRFAHLPTPVEELPRLSGFLNGPRLLVKRDDQTGLALGGNKTRKLEYLLAEAQSNGARTLITVGAIQSNHCRQTAAAAARNGFDCILVLTYSDSTKIPGSNLVQNHHREDRDNTTKLSSGNLILDKLFGAELVWASGQESDMVLEHTYQKALDDGRKPFLIPRGGSNVIGATAYVTAMEELLAQISDLSITDQAPDSIVFPSASGGTQAGLVLGGSMLGYDGQILGISIDKVGSALQESVASLATETANFLGESKQFMADEIVVNDDFLGEGYGVLGEPEKEAIRLFATSEGLLLDPVYTGRAAAGMIRLIREGYFRNDQTILFWHTGGVPALFADEYQGLI
jgi:D-cysteine desulfhydrase family pyridoxal phosphate-dependent enzyme